MPSVLASLGPPPPGGPGLDRLDVCIRPGGGKVRHNLAAKPEEKSRLNPFCFYSDQPLSIGGVDEPLGLGREKWARLIAEAAVGTPGPFTIGVYAPWGRGKTSVLNRAAWLASLEKNVEAFVVKPGSTSAIPTPYRLTGHSRS